MSGKVREFQFAGNWSVVTLMITLIQFICDSIDGWLFADDLEQFFTTAEKQRIIRYVLESIRAPSPEGEKVPGTRLFLYPGEAMC